MSILVVGREQLSERQNELVNHAIEWTNLPDNAIELRLDKQWNGLGFAWPTDKGPQPQDSYVAKFWREGRQHNKDFLVMIGESALARTEVELVITLAHELEHVRQGLEQLGISRIGASVFDFVEENPHLFGGDIVDHYDIPLNYHAEMAGAACATDVLGAQTVRNYYAALHLPSRLKFADPPLGAHLSASSDLADFLSRRWSAFQSWFEAVKVRPVTLAKVEEFVKKWAG